MAEKIGFQCRLYYGTAGSTADTLVTGTVDVTLNIEKAEVDNTARGDTWESVITGLLNGSADFQLKYNESDTAYVALRTAFLAGTPIALAFLDGVDGKGLDADFSITAFNHPQPLKDLAKVDVSVRPYTGNRTPTWKVA